MSYEFQDAAPIKIQGTGRKVEDSPFTAVIAEIALKTSKVDGKEQPVAKAFTVTHDTGDRVKTVNRIKSVLSRTGERNDPAVTVYTKGTPVVNTVKGKNVESDTETLITFWTVKRQIRPRKVDGTSPATASTDQSTAVAAPATA